ncbi:MAG: 2OG-Fe(II) oxygenase [Pseudomonadota bacterium]|nr:2OG-Fe(II) oxygenase [Pseudomonadota bacterium]
MAPAIDLDRYPLDRQNSVEYRELVRRCRSDLARHGMFTLDGLVKLAAVARVARELYPLFAAEAFFHRRLHNIYFRDKLDDLPADHPALGKFETINHTICADQIPDSLVLAVYEWPDLAHFLAEVMEKPRLYTMADPLARTNVMAYRHGEALNWHFDRSEFTTTLLIQAPEGGGEFQYRPDLRSDSDPNYDGVAKLVRGLDPQVKVQPLSAGTLNVFKGRNTAHRVTPIEGATDRIIAVFSYYERPGVMFSDEERIGFYGRAA